MNPIHLRGPLSGRIRGRFGATLALAALVAALSSTPGQHPIWSRTGALSGDQYGAKVAIGLDANADGIPDILVGAPLSDRPGVAVDTGVVELLSGQDGSLLWRAFGASAQARLGGSVWLTSDLSGDGLPDVFASTWTGLELRNGATGALLDSVTYPGIMILGILQPRSDVLATRHLGTQVLTSMTVPFLTTRSVELRVGLSSSPLLTFQPTLPVLPGFGEAIAGGGVMPGGSFVVVGARFETDSASSPNHRRGAIYVYDAVSAALRWSAPGSAALDHLGTSVAILPDLDQDGVSEVLAGAPAADIGLSQVPGSCRLYSGANGTVLRTLVGLAPDDQFGTSVTGTGDLDRDGVPDFAVGAIRGGANGTGYVRTFSGATGLLIAHVDGDLAAQSFASSLAAAGDLEDGIADLVVGSPAFDGTSTDLGRIRLVEHAAQPGSKLDLVMATGVSGPETRRSVRDIYGGQLLTASVRSPNGTFTGASMFLFAQVYPTGSPYPPFAGLPDAHIDPTINGTWVILQNEALAAPGSSFAIPAIAGLGGLSINLQAVVFSPQSPTGYATTNAHELRHLNHVDFYVSPTGSNANAGTSPTAPLATIGEAIVRSKLIGNPAISIPYPRIKVAVGVYTETPTLDAPISMDGGLDPVTFVRVPGFYSIVATNNGGIRVANIATTTMVRGFDFQSGNGLYPGSNGPIGVFMASIAAQVRNCSTALQFDDCRFQSGTGAAGPNGSHGAQGAPGGDGAPGQDGFNLLGSGSNGGGVGGSGIVGGGNGGSGGWFQCNYFLGVCTSTVGTGGDPGSGGYSSQNPGGGPGSGGAPATCGYGAPGGSGQNGIDGAPGANGTPSVATMGTIIGGDWSPVRSFTGGFGGNGSGGGGGGGGGTSECAQVLAVGGGGGGGGAGGQGGSGGQGGASGGASIAVYLYAASPTFTGCRFTSGNGGPGGTGGNGAYGGSGGSGGAGGDEFNMTVLGVGIRGGWGGWGGRGGFGGAGGGGAGGNGGPSIGLLRAGSSFPPNFSINGNVFLPGFGGTPGAGGHQSVAGPQAVSGQPGPRATSVAL